VIAPLGPGLGFNVDLEYIIGRTETLMRLEPH